MRTFKLRRIDDATGISGTGVVAEGVEFSNGNAVLNWLTKHRSMGMYPNMKELENIHGHEGKTVVEWDDIPQSGVGPIIGINPVNYDERFPSS